MRYEYDYNIIVSNVCVHQTEIVFGKNVLFTKNDTSCFI